MTETAKIYQTGGMVEILVGTGKGTMRYCIMFPDVSEETIMAGIIESIRQFADDCLEACDG
ncbi:MAG: hypothetical protein DRJ03_22880 [Chloroflexi bacterium]|nr:MAG: hypothetical protein DRJ03_22880 [Chloroflexota bacterium]